MDIQKKSRTSSNKTSVSTTNDENGNIKKSSSSAKEPSESVNENENIKKSSSSDKEPSESVNENENIKKCSSSAKEPSESVKENGNIKKSSSSAKEPSESVNEYGNIKKSSSSAKEPSESVNEYGNIKKSSSSNKEKSETKETNLAKAEDKIETNKELQFNEKNDLSPHGLLHEEKEDSLVLSYESHSQATALVSKSMEEPKPECKPVLSNDPELKQPLFKKSEVHFGDPTATRYSSTTTNSLKKSTLSKPRNTQLEKPGNLTMKVINVIKKKEKHFCRNPIIDEMCSRIRSTCGVGTMNVNDDDQNEFLMHGKGGITITKGEGKSTAKKICLEGIEINLYKIDNEKNHQQIQSKKPQKNVLTIYDYKNKKFGD